MEHTGKVIVQFGGGHFTEISSARKAVDVGIIHHEKLVILYDNGNDVVYNLDDFLKD